MSSESSLDWAGLSRGAGDPNIQLKPLSLPFVCLGTLHNVGWLLRAQSYTVNPKGFYYNVPDTQTLENNCPNSDSEPLRTITILPVVTIIRRDNIKSRITLFMFWLMSSFDSRPIFVAQIFVHIFILMCPVPQCLQILLWNHSTLFIFFRRINVGLCRPRRADRDAKCLDHVEMCPFHPIV